MCACPRLSVATGQATVAHGMARSGTGEGGTAGDDTAGSGSAERCE